MSGSIQSSNYVPGVSGWKLNTLTGEFEINSCIIGSAANAPERQMVSVEVASWSKYDLPKNAANLLQFMQAELQKVPEQYRHAAEFEEFDASYDDESFNARLFLSYSRLETEEELADRLLKAKSAGPRISVKDGVLTVSDNGVARFRLGNLDQPPRPKPFVVVDDVTYLRATDIASEWSVKMQLTAGGQYVVAGIGQGLDSQCLVNADQFSIKLRQDFEEALADGDASKICESLASFINTTDLAADLRKQIEARTEEVRRVIRDELRPGGLLHCSR